MIMREMGRNTETSRRSILKKIGGASTAGLGTTVGFSGTAAAFHCVNEPEDDSNYEQKASTTSEDIDVTFKLGSSTELSHVKTITSDGMHNHIFYFVTTAGSEWIDGGWGPAIRDHEVEVEVDSVNFDSATIDFCESTTGVYPSEESDGVKEVWDFLAGETISALAGNLSLPLDVLKTAIAVKDSMDRSTGPQYQKLTYSRTGGGELPQNKTKVQGAFEITRDEDTWGEVEFRSRTDGYNPRANPCFTDCPRTTTVDSIPITFSITGGVTVGSFD